MKSQFKKVLFIELILFVFSFINALLKLNYFIFLIELVILCLILSKILKIDKRNSRFDVEIALLILIVTISYYLITYFMGFFFGFLYSTYSRRLKGIIYNILTSSFYIILSEYIREKVIKSGKYYKFTIFLTIFIFTLLELVGIFNFKSLSSNYLILQFILSIFIPIFLKNILLSILCYYTNKKLTILYQLIMILPKYILGVFPDLGDYLNSIFLTVLPLILLYLIFRFINVKKEKIENGRKLKFNKTLSYIITFFTTLFVITLVYLVSGFGKLQIMAIGSGSMSYTINKGDAVIINKNYKNLKAGDIIAFKMEGKVIVHRIVKIEKTKKGNIYNTKGDFNNDVDGWVLSENSIIGKCKFRILFIGWPSVILSELISG